TTRRRPTFRNPLQSIAGHTRDTSLPGHPARSWNRAAMGFHNGRALYDFASERGGSTRRADSHRAKCGGGFGMARICFYNAFLMRLGLAQLLVQPPPVEALRRSEEQ